MRRNFQCADSGGRCGWQRFSDSVLRTYGPDWNARRCVSAFAKRRVFFSPRLETRRKFEFGGSGKTSGGERDAEKPVDAGAVALNSTWFKIPEREREREESLNTPAMATREKRESTRVETRNASRRLEIPPAERLSGWEGEGEGGRREVRRSLRHERNFVAGERTGARAAKRAPFAVVARRISSIIRILRVSYVSSMASYVFSRPVLLLPRSSHASGRSGGWEVKTKELGQTWKH